MKIQLLVPALFLVIGSTMYSQNILSVGDRAPVFSAPADDGTTWDIKKYLGKNLVVVYFYPAAMTSGCTKQACSYRDHKNDLQESGAVVVGISGDKIETLKLFKQAENLNFTLLSDENGSIAGEFGVPVTEGGSIKRTIAGTDYELVHEVTAKRWTFIIGRDGKIIYKNDSVDAEKDTDEVLEFIKIHAMN